MLEANILSTYLCKNCLCKWNWRKQDSHWMKYVTLQFERKNFIGCLGAVIIKVWKTLFIGCWTCLKQTFRDIGLLSEHFGAAFLSECLPWISLCLCNFVHLEYWHKCPGLISCIHFSALFFFMSEQYFPKNWRYIFCVGCLNECQYLW